MLLAAMGQGNEQAAAADDDDDEAPLWERLFDRSTLLVCGGVIGACAATLAVLALRASLRGAAR